VRQAEGGDELVAAVREHVSSYRVPCLAELGGAAALDFEFTFTPGAEFARTGLPTDAETERRRTLFACVTPSVKTSRPRYPEEARRIGQQARVLARVTFTAADRPPEVQTLIAGVQNRHFERSVLQWLSGMRMPCFSGAPAKQIWTMVFKMEDAAPFGLHDQSFLKILASTEGIEQQRVQLDTRTMGCPFDVSFVYLQPHAPNLVAELGNHEPARAPLLALDVPCVNIDLKPKEAAAPEKTP
jgi:hypothetical protein